jgi:hypothetical protein
MLVIFGAFRGMKVGIGLNFIRELGWKSEWMSGAEIFHWLLVLL